MPIHLLSPTAAASLDRSARPLTPFRTHLIAVWDFMKTVATGLPRHVLRHVCNWRKLTQHPQLIQVNPPKQVYPDIRLPRNPGGLA
jgi:hypothetical protein